MARSNALHNRMRRILRALAAAYPEAHCALHYTDPLQLLIAAILSAQCTDKRVNLVTPALFRHIRMRGPLPRPTRANWRR